MIQYNPKDWFTFIFRLHKADTIQALFFMMLTIGLYTALVIFVGHDLLHVNEKDDVKGLLILHTLMGSVIGLLLVFRTNTAYDRWWEGRKLWGTLVNNSRSLAIKLNSFLDEKDIPNRKIFKRLLVLYPYSLRNHLLAKNTGIELFDKDMYLQAIPNIDTTKHVPNQVVNVMYKKLQGLVKENKLTEMQLLVINEEVKSYSDICGACERIRNTPIPYSYSVFLKKFIFFYVMTLPFALMVTLHYLAIPVVIFVFYVLASLEMIAEEIEDPFGEDANDLPTDKIANNIKKHVSEIFGVA